MDNVDSCLVWPQLALDLGVAVSHMVIHFFNKFNVINGWKNSHMLATKQYTNK